MRAVLGSRLRLVAVMPLLAALGACETSSRLGSMMPGGGAPSPRVSQRSAPAPLTPAPVGEVYTSDLGGGGTSTASLPPPSGGAPLPSPSSAPRAGGLAAPGNLPGGGGSYSAPIDPVPGGASAPPASGAPTYFPSGGAPATSPATPPRVASAPSTSSSGGSASPSRNNVVGNWSVSEASGGSCRITLSSAPKLDLYGAGTNGCQSKELQRVNAWELSGSEVLLYEPGGGVVARLRQSGGGYAGATAKTGAPVSLSK